MKTRERKDLRELRVDELNTKLLEAKQELFNLRFQLATRSLSNYSRMREVRKEIACLKTMLRERALGIR